MRGTRLVIADRHPIVLRGLTSLSESHRDFAIVASCHDGASCVEAIRNLAPDVALLEDSLSDVTASEILAIANAENLSLADMEAGLRIVQSCDPAGVAARDLQECLLLQLASRNGEEGVAWQIISKHLGIDQQIRHVMCREAAMMGNYTGWVQFRKTIPNEHDFTYVREKEAAAA